MLQRAFSPLVTSQLGAMTFLWVWLLIGLAQSTTLIPARPQPRAGGHFESCASHQLQDQWRLRKGDPSGDEALRPRNASTSLLPSPALVDVADVAGCERGGGTVFWPPEGSRENAFCCPWNANWCGGCAKPNSAKDGCERCRGGWALETGRCHACLDIPWHDPQGRNCYAVVKEGGCSKRRFHGLSSARACCACGGGLREATEFRYYSEPLLVGDSAGQVKGYPLPRTASRYSVDSNCGLLDVNLTIDGNTGELRLVPGCSSVGCGQLINDFMITCTITAHEGSLEASTQMMITGSRFMVWQSSVLVVPPGLTQAFPSRSVCVPAKPCFLEMVCVPLSSPSWLQLENHGGLTVSNDGSGSKASEIPGLTALNNLAGLEASSGSLCSVRNGSGVAAAVLALVPQAWSSIKYGYEAVSVDLNTTLQPPLEPQDGGASPGRVAPMRFSASCSTDVASVSVDFDELTGLATAQGYRIFHLDVHHGVLQVSPEANLSHLFDRIQLNRVRAGIHVSCTILGHFEWQVGVPVRPIKGAIEILVQDSTCWPLGHRGRWPIHAAVDPLERPFRFMVLWIMSRL
eukprot:s2771_g4.t1